LSPRAGLATVATLVAVASLAGCKGSSKDEGATRPADAAVAVRARPAELVHVTLKVLGMT
jgi:hypothetical protein